MQGQQNKKGILLVLIGGTFWGISGTCGQFLFQHRGLTPEWLVAFRLLIAGALLLLLTYKKEKEKIFKIWKNKIDRNQILVFSIFGMSMCQLTYFTAIGYSNAGTATVLQYLGPAFIMIYISLRKKTMPTPLELIAVGCAMAGTFLMATHGNIKTMALSKEALTWGLLSAVALAIYTTQPGRLLKEWGAFIVTGWGMLVGGIALSIVFQVWNVVGHFDLLAIIALAFIIIFGTIISFTCYLEGVRIIGPKKGSLYACVEPLSATIFSVLALKVSFVMLDLLGFLFIIATIFLLSAGNRQEAV